MDDEEIEDDFEETILVVDLNGLPNPGIIKQINGPCYILGIESDSPVIQFGSFVFKGHYEDIVGTGLLFERVTENNKSKCNFIGKSYKRICATRTILKKKIQHEEPLPEEPPGTTKPDKALEETPMETDNNAHVLADNEVNDAHVLTDNDAQVLTHNNEQ